VTGTLRVVRSVEDAGDVTDGDVVYLPDARNRGDAVPLFHTVIRRGAGGLLCERVGRGDHGAILANELGVPCVSGIDRRIASRAGEVVTVAGDSVFEGVREFDPEPAPELERRAGETDARLMINLGFPEVIEREPALVGGVDGVGFMRLEFLMLEVLDGRHPLDYLAEHGQAALAGELADRIRPVVRAFGDRPVRVRTDDFSVPQLASLASETRREADEENPMLGWRGVARSIEEPALLEAEFRALRSLLEEGYGNVGVFPPMTRFPEEYERWKSIAERVGVGDASLGLMVETPAAALTVEEFVDDVEFVIFGSNDLTQFTLAIDRGNPRLETKFDESRTAVRRLLRRVIDVCTEHGVESSIGGEAASDPELASRLLEFGISGFSVNPDARTVDRMSRLLSDHDERGR
jgi:pyruvate,water dikinase